MNIYEGTNMTENSIYPIIKSGITNYTRQLASKYGKYNIRVNTVVRAAYMDTMLEQKPKHKIKNF